MVHQCDKPCGNKTASGYCATTACINPKYSNIGTAQYGQGVRKCIVTNADRIKSAKTVEELMECIFHALKMSEQYNDSRRGMVKWLESTQWGYPIIPAEEGE